MCMSASLLLTLCVTSLMFQELSRAELGARALGKFPVRIVNAVWRPSGEEVDAVVWGKPQLARSQGIWGGYNHKRFEARVEDV